MCLLVPHSLLGLGVTLDTVTPTPTSTLILDSTCFFSQRPPEIQIHKDTESSKGPQ